jgi:protein disulfide-isomerase
MRLSRLFAFLPLVAPLLALPSDTEHNGTPASISDIATEENAEGESTVFNGETVPPMRTLNGETLDEDIKNGYWLVEFYSPYCYHCRALAPILQTLYEFYYTLKPVLGTSSSSENLNSFTRYYDFKFAKLDCVAFGTACSEKGVQSFPTLLLFKDGKEIKKQVGSESLENLSTWVEEALESIRPGSRPTGGPLLPEVGASSVDETQAPSKDKGTAPNEKQEVATKSKVTFTATKASAGLPATSTKPKLSGAPNPSGTSVPLTAESFQRLVTNTMDPWFVKFYAPWCHHCQAMAPNWAEMAREMEGVLNVGEVNCDVEKRLCRDARVKGYPTLLFFRGGERVEYNGLRGVGDLISYAKKAIDVGSGVNDVDAASFEIMEESEEVIFLYFYDHATVSEDFAALERLTLSLIGHAKLVKTRDPKLAERFKISTWPRLMVSRDGKPSYYPHIAPKDMRDFRKLLAWMKTVWQPIVPELTASNAREIMDGRYVVLGILSRSRSDEFVIAKREIKNAALEWIDKETHARQLERQELRDTKQLRIEEAEDRNDQRALRAAKQIRINVEEMDRPQVGFAWVDGVFWERWIRTTYGIDVNQNGERVVINDEDVRFHVLLQTSHIPKLTLQYRTAVTGTRP